MRRRDWSLAAHRPLPLLLCVVVLAGCKAWRPLITTSSPAAGYARGEAAMQRNDFSTAIPAYEAYLAGTDASPFRPRAYYQLARAQFGLGEFNQTVLTTERLEREFPEERWPQVAALRGNAEYAMGRRMEAFLAWQTAWNRGNEADQAALRERMERAVSEMTPSELRELDELITETGPRAMLEARETGGAELPPLTSPPPEPPTRRDEEAKAVPAKTFEAANEPDRQVGPPLAELADMEPLPRPEGLRLHLGALLPLSGSERNVGRRALKGMRLALADQPDRLVVRDTGSNPRLAAQLFGALANNPSVLTIIAPIGSAEAAAVAPLANELRVPLLLLSHDTGAGGRFVIPLTAAPMQEQVRVLVGYAVDRLRAERLGALYADDGYGRALVKLLRDEVQGRGATIIGLKGYAPDKAQFAAEVVEVQQWTKQGGLEALLLLDPTETAITLGTALRDKLPDLPLLGTEGWNDATRLATLGEHAEGVVFVAAGDGGDPRLHEYAGEAPTAAEAQAFDTAMLARQVIESGVTTREQALSELLRRGSPGDALAPRASAAIRLLRVHNGKAEPVAAAPVW